MNIWGIVRNAAGLILPRYADGALKQPNLTVAGNVAVEQILTTPGGLVPALAETDSGAITAGQTTALTISLPYIFDPVAGDWIRPDTLPDNADAQAALGVGAQGVVARLQGWNGATYDRIGSQGDNADGVAVETLGRLKILSHNAVFNGVTWDRARANTEFEMLSAAVRNATTTSADFTNYNASKALFFLNVSAAAGGGQTLIMSVQAKDPVSGNYFTLITGAATAITGLTVVSISGLAANILTRTFRVTVTHSGVGNWTYSVGASLAST